MLYLVLAVKCLSGCLFSGQCTQQQQYAHVRTCTFILYSACKIINTVSADSARVFAVNCSLQLCWFMPAFERLASCLISCSPYAACINMMHLARVSRRPKSLLSKLSQLQAFWWYVQAGQLQQD
jgi:hypothetical protein